MAMPTSNFAGILIVPDYPTPDNASHSMHVQLSESHHDYMQDYSAPQDTGNHKDYECGCNGDTNHCVSSGSASALTNVAGVDLSCLSQAVYHAERTLAVSPDPHLLFKPPISLS